MPTHTVVNPSDSYWLTHVAPADNEEDGRIATTNWNVSLREQYAVAAGCDAYAEDAEAIAMAELVRDQGCYCADDGGDDEDRNAADLRDFGFVAQLGQNGWCEVLRQY